MQNLIIAKSTAGVWSFQKSSNGTLTDGTKYTGPKITVGSEKDQLIINNDGSKMYFGYANVYYKDTNYSTLEELLDELATDGLAVNFNSGEATPLPSSLELNNLTLNNYLNNKKGQFTPILLTDDRTYYIPDKTGVLSLQHNLLNQYAIIPNLNTAGFNSIGKGINTAGALLSKNWSSTSVLTKQNRIGFDTTSTDGTISYLRQIGGYFSINQGFHYVVYFGGSTGFNLSGVRAYIGITYSNNTTGNVEQDTMINSIGIGRLSNSNNWWFMHNDASGTATKIDTGFLANTVDADLFKLEIYTFNGQLAYRLTKEGASSVGSLVTTDLPDGDLPLTQRVFVTNNANASQVVLDFGGSTLNI